MKLDQGTVLEGKYRIERLLGAGGMGAVYEAKHIGVSRKVAIKVLHPDIASDPTVKTRFKREAKAAGRIGHDNICEVFDFGVDPDGAEFFVMPCLKGKSLEDAICEDGLFTIRRAVDIASQILSALEAAHAVGLIHRDLKPENVFLTKVGDREDFVKVLDFGISKVMADAVTGSGSVGSITETGTVLGTPFYMSPEHARGLKDIDGRVDVYAVGVIVYEMLTGERPIEGDNLSEIIWKIWNHPIRSPRAVRPGIPELVESVVLRAMNRDRDERYASAHDFRTALLKAASEAGERFSELPSTLTAPVDVLSATLKSASPSASHPFVKTVAQTSARRSTINMAAVGAFVVTLVVAGIVVALLSQDSGSGTPGEDESEPQSPPPSPTIVATADDAPPASEDHVPTSSQVQEQVVTNPETHPAPGEVSPTPSIEVAHEDDPSSAAMPAQPTPVEQPEMVRIVLTGVPREATVLVDGRPISGNTVEVPRSEGVVPIVVEAEGFVRWSRNVSTTESVSVPIELRAVPSEPRRPRRRGQKNVPGTLPNFGEVP